MSEAESTAPQAPTTVTRTHTYNTRLQSSLSAASVSNTQPNPSSVESTITGNVQGGGSKLDVEASIENNVEEPAASSKLKKVPFQKTVSNVATPMSGNELYLPTTAFSPKGSIPTSHLSPLVVHPGRKIFQDFSKSYPSLWFATFELRLNCWEIKSEKMKTDILVAHLTDEILLVVQDIILNNPTYASLKTRLLQTFEPSMTARVSQLLNPETLGDRKPSEMLTFLKANVARNDISENMLKELFISRMPENVRMSLCTMPHASLDALAAAADKMMETTSAMMFAGSSSFQNSYVADNRLLTAKLEALESKINNFVYRSSSNHEKTQQRPQFQRTTTQTPRPFRPQSKEQRFQQGGFDFQNSVCYYHQKFGDRAHRCTAPCSWRGNAAQGNWKHPRR